MELKPDTSSLREQLKHADERIADLQRALEDYELETGGYLLTSMRLEAAHRHRSRLMTEIYQLRLRAVG